MLEFTSITKYENECFATLTLPFDLRQKARLHVTLDNGEEAGLFLPRGNIIRDGDILQAESGEYIQVIAADELVSTASSSDTLLLSRACYHLGNRHVPLQVSKDWIRYLHDHVLDEMVLNIGLDLIQEQAPFEPEPGAYSKHHSHEH